METASSATPIPTVADIDRIVAIADHAERNHRITHGYHALSNAMTAVVGTCANWCTFATWASRQAGQTIRGEDLAQSFEDCMHGSRALIGTLETIARMVAGARLARDADAFVRSVRAALGVDAALARVGDAVARGNRKVFEEIARHFARFLDDLANDAAYDEARVAAFCAALRDGDPPDGQRLLRDAFRTYARARFESDATTRSQMLFRANLLVGLHEQRRLQPEITEALSTGLGDRATLKRTLRRLLLPRLWSRIVERLASVFTRRPSIDAMLDDLVDAIVIALREATTAALMTLRFPDGVVLRLGVDLPGTYPKALERIVDAELAAILAAVDPTPDSLRETGARDWADFDDRMHFIADLFRSRHEDRSLFAAP